MFANAPRLNTFLKVTGHILLAAIACATVFLTVRIAVMPFLVSIIAPSEIQEHAIKGLGSLIAVSVGYYLFVKFYEKRRVTELAINGLEMLSAFLAGGLVISITTGLLFVLGYYQVVSTQPLDEVVFAVIGLTTQAIFGAILFSGIFFRIIEQKVGSQPALVTLSIALGLLNILVDGLNVMVLVSSIVINALWFGIYIYSRNLWVVGLANGAWLSAVFATGILDEHWRASAPIISSAEGSTIITGGTFGPEHSIITILVVSISLLALLRKARQQGQWINR